MENLGLLEKHGFAVLGGDVYPWSLRLAIVCLYLDIQERAVQEDMLENSGFGHVAVAITRLSAMYDSFCTRLTETRRKSNQITHCPLNSEHTRYDPHKHYSPHRTSPASL
jgi:hypothetical protein